MDGDIEEPSFSRFQFAWSVGFVLGFDIGYTSGLLSSPMFLKEFFPNAYTYWGCCDFVANLHRSSLYLIAFISAYKITSLRIPIHVKLRLCGCLIHIGMMITLAAINALVITCGRTVFAVGIGIAIQVVATHAASEDSPSGHRTRIMTLFPHGITSGILMANLLFYWIRYSRDGIEVAGFSSYLSLFALMLCGCLPEALLFNQHLSMEDAKNYAKAIRLARLRESVLPISIVFERKYVGLLVMAMSLSIFQQLTGAYAYMIYAPVLFKAIGLGNGVVTAMYGVNWIVACVSFATIDRFRRRSLFMQGGITMLISLIISTFIHGVHENLGAMHNNNAAILMVVSMSAYVAGYSWSWGPLGWLVPGEILPLRIQPIGYGLCACTNMLSMFFVSQFFTTGLCQTKFWMHLVILCLVLLMTAFVYVFLPEIKGVEVENFSKIWEKHWFWKRIITE